MGEGAQHRRTPESVRVIVESTSARLARRVCHAVALALRGSGAKAYVIKESGEEEQPKADGDFKGVKAELFHCLLSVAEDNYTITGHTLVAPKDR